VASISPAVTRGGVWRRSAAFSSDQFLADAKTKLARLGGLENPAMGLVQIDQVLATRQFVALLRRDFGP
jgi:hypothetical protein